MWFDFSMSIESEPADNSLLVKVLCFSLFPPLKVCVEEVLLVKPQQPIRSLKHWMFPGWFCSPWTLSTRYKIQLTALSVIYHIRALTDSILQYMSVYNSCKHSLNQFLLSILSRVFNNNESAFDFKTILRQCILNIKQTNTVSFLPRGHQVISADFSTVSRSS